ncbi:MAG: hypothetical protein ACKVP4_11050 [Hyphomicrobium sp.]
MDRKYVGAAALGLVAVAIAGSVILARSGEPTTTVTAPGVRVETGRENGDATITAPYTNIEKDADGTRIQAPGVDINIPRKSSE